jgi:prepilin-type N-terminal cleavage/methylation domain-containing protein
MRRGRQTHGAFTLLEVMITLAILAVGLLALLIMQVHALSGGAQGKHSTAAAAIARDQIERIQRMPFSDADLQPVAWTTPPWLPGGGGLAPGEVPYRVDQPGGSVTELTYTVFYRVLADPGGNADLRNVDVEVVWQEKDVANNRPTRTGQPTAALSTVLVNNDK